MICVVCKGTGYMYKTPDSLDAQFDAISVSYQEMKCWRCVGTGFLTENPHAPLSIEEESLDADKTITNDNQIWSE